MCVCECVFSKLKVQVIAVTGLAVMPGLTGLGVGHNEGKGGEIDQEDQVDEEVAEVAGTAIGTPLVVQKADH